MIAVLLPTKSWAADGVSEPYAVLSDNNTVLTFYYDDQREARGGTLISQDGYPTWGSYEQVVESVVFDLAFANCTSITSTVNWFFNFANLKSITGLQYLNTANVTDMNSMFAGCSSLTSLDLSNFNTSNVTNMFGLFRNCSGLTSLDLSNFNTENVTDMSAMFLSCSNLSSLNIRSFNTSKVGNMESMFYTCSSLTNLDLSHFNTANVGDMKQMFQGCTGLTSLNVSNFNTEKVGNMYFMFEGCSNLQELDLGSFITTNVSDMTNMFAGCSSLTSLNVSSFSTPSLIDMTEIFSGCSRLTSLDVRGFNTQNVTSLYGIFSSCSSLTSLDVSNFNTQNVTNMSGVFSDCSGLTSLDVRNFNTEKVVGMGSMFSGCSGLTSLDVSNFKTDNVANMIGMFAGCSSLTSLDVSAFNTENLTNMYEMFRGCSNMSSLDLSGFKTDKVTHMTNMFDGCSNLKTIYAGSGWSTVNVSYGTNVFRDCTSLVGGAGTTYDVSHTDYTYAHIDGGTANPGYFTDKNATPAVVEPYAVLSENNTVLTFYYDDQKEARSGMSVGPFTDYGQNGWRNLNVTKVVFDQTFANCRPTSTAFWFDGLYYLNEIEGIENLNTDNVTDMRSMFEACSSLTSIDFSHFNTENVTSFDHMFWNCTSLTNLDLSSFNTQKVMSTYWMFALCNRLTSVNLNGFNTSSMETMEGMFYDCASLAAIQAGSAAIPDSIYAQVNNPNLLVYVNEAAMAPSGVQNVVINGQAREIVLTDATTVNNNFYVPQTFTAERISYTRNFTQSTQVGVSRGWESIALPFDVQSITHETKGTIAPFGNTASNRHFWLRELGSNGLQSATGIAANTPYVISMPNSSDYTDSYNLAGRVTFAAENTQVPVTEVKASAMADQSIVMIPTMQRQERSSEVWALNVGEVRGRYLEGSVFERDYREVRPFEAFTVHRQENTQPAPRYVPLQEIGGTTGIHSVESGELRTEKWYDLNGRQLQGKPSAKGVYINNGQKIVIR